MPKYNLEPLDSNLIAFVHRQQQSIYSGLLSSIATRLNYKVTDRTAFELSPDLTELTIKEIDPKEVKDNAVKTA